MKLDYGSGGQSDTIAGSTIGGDIESRNVGNSKKLEEKETESSPPSSRKKSPANTPISASWEP